MFNRVMCLFVAISIFGFCACSAKGTKQKEISSLEKVQMEHIKTVPNLTYWELVNELDKEYADLHQAYIVWLNKQGVSIEGTTEKKKFPFDECARETYARLEYIKKLVEEASKNAETKKYDQDLIINIVYQHLYLWLDMDKTHSYRKLDKEVILKMIFINHVLSMLIEE